MKNPFKSRYVRLALTLTIAATFFGLWQWFLRPSRSNGVQPIVPIKRVTTAAEG